MAKPKIIVGLTGGIASGKSEVGKFIAPHFDACWDADIWSREIVDGHFPEILQLLNLPTTATRADLRKSVFGSVDLRKRLEHFVHPKLRERLKRETGTHPGKFFLYEASLILETGIGDNFTKLLICHAPWTVRKTRTEKRGKFTAEEIEQVSRAQFSDQARVAYSTNHPASMMIDTSVDWEQTTKFIQEKVLPWIFGRNDFFKDHR